MKLLTHNDLDGYGCRFVLDNIYNFETIIHSNYEDISEYLKAIKLNSKDKILLITDLNFKKENIKEMLNLLKDGWKIRYFDHHKYDENILKIFEKLKKYDFKYIIDTNRSATKIVFDTFKHKLKLNEQKLKNLTSLVEIINTYDLWKLESPLWDKAFAINNIFYLVGENNFYRKVSKNEFVILNEFKEQYKEYIKRKNQYFNYLKEKGNIIANDNILLVIMESYEFSSFVTFEFPNYQHYIIVYPFANRISLRHRDISEEEMEKKFNKLIQITHPKINSIGGHLFAQGITLYNDTKIEDLYEIIEMIGNILK